MAVGKVVVEHEQKLLFACLLVHYPQRHICADRVFRKVHHKLAACDIESFQPSVVHLKMLEGIMQRCLVKVIEL